MGKRKQIEEILLNDYGCFDDFTVDKLCDLFIVSNPKGAVCLEHDSKGDSFDHFGFCLEEVCENCGEKRGTGC